MNWLLIIIVLLLALCVVNGYRKGFLTHDVFYGIVGDHVCAGNVGDAVYQYISEE